MEYLKIFRNSKSRRLVDGSNMENEGRGGNFYFHYI